MPEQQRTKMLLINSVKELLLETPFEKITVKMIVENCNVTRQTFYNHFFDKFELVNLIFKECVDNVTPSISVNTPWEIVLGKMLEAMVKDRPIYRNVIRCSEQNSLQNYIRDFTCQAYCSDVSKRIYPRKIDNDIIFSINFNSFGAAGTICHWIKDGMLTDPYILAKQIASNMPDRMKPLYNLTSTTKY